MGKQNNFSICFLIVIILNGFSMGIANISYEASFRYFVVANCEEGSISIVDHSKNIRTIPILKGLKEIIWDGSGTLFASCTEENSLCKLDLTNLSWTISDPIFFDPRGLVMDAEGKQFYVLSKEKECVFQVDPQNFAILGSYPTGGGPRRIIMNSTGDVLYVTNNYDDSVIAISLKLEGDSIICSGINKPYGIRFNHKNGLLYVTSIGENKIYVLDPITMYIKYAFAVCEHPTDIVFDYTNNRMFVPCMDDDLICVLNTQNNQIIKNIFCSKAPFGIGITSDEKYLAISCNQANKIELIDLVSLEKVDEFIVGQDPHAVSFIDPLKRKLKSFEGFPEELKSNAIQ